MHKFVGSSFQEEKNLKNKIKEEKRYEHVPSKDDDKKEKNEKCIMNVCEKYLSVLQKQVDKGKDGNGNMLSLSLSLDNLSSFWITKYL